MLGMFGARFVLRTARTRPDQVADDHKRVLIIGAGDGGRQVVRSLVRDRGARMHPVGILDDDPRKRRLRIEGVRVLGTRADLAEAATRTEATTVAIAIPSADAEMVRTCMTPHRAWGSTSRSSRARWSCSGRQMRTVSAR
ncbi:nucleoside-diphosphate sugar epimerase/dehydratase [Janibacter melonis]|uniref:nucleoside-diphosphate sugar epimerase/dehydratase n=1 Tax=Janibacter melonis TaxID=262209 RepID=UPI0027DAADA2|nr:NAD-binding protein [Janibacter melonis]